MAKEAVLEVDGAGSATRQMSVGFIPTVVPKNQAERVKEILAMSHSERILKVTLAEAKRLNFVTVDGANSAPLFIGTQAEYEARLEAARGFSMSPSLIGRRFGGTATRW